MNRTITVSMNKQTCGQCHKVKTGCYETGDGRHICQACVLKNIGRQLSSHLPGESQREVGPVGLRRFLKIKLSSNRVQLTYEHKSPTKPNEWDEYSVSCLDDPAPGFIKGLADLAPFVVSICELHQADLSRIAVHGVSLSYGGDNDILGATIIAVKKLAKSTNDLNLNTPHKTEEFYSETGDERQLLPDGCADAIRDLCDQAEKYLNGHRAQTTLDLPAPASPVGAHGHAPSSPVGTRRAVSGESP